MDRYFNGETARVSVVLTNASGAGLTGLSATISLYIIRQSDGWFWNGTAFQSGSVAITPLTETNSSAMPGRYHYNLTLQNAVVRVRAVTNSASAVIKEFDGEIMFSAPPSAEPSGDNTLVVTVEAPGGTPVPQARVTIKNNTQTATIAIGDTDPLGNASFALDDGDYVILVSKPPFYSWTQTPINVSGSSIVVQTVVGSVSVVTPPSSPDLCAVVLYSTYATVSGAVTFEAHANQIVNGMAIDVTPVLATALSGYYQADLVRGALYTLRSSRYFGRVMSFEVPAQGTVDLSSVLIGLREIEQ